MLERANSLQTELVALQLFIQRQDLNQRSDHAVKNVRHGVAGLPHLLKTRIVQMFTVSEPERDAVRLSALLIVTVAGLIAGVVVRRNSRPPRKMSTSGVTIQILFTTWYVIRHWAPVLVPVVGVSIYLAFAERGLFGEYLINKLIMLGIAYLLSLIFIRASVRWYAIYSRTKLNRTIPDRAFYIRLLVAATTSALWLALIILPDDISPEQSPNILLHNLLASAVILSHFDIVRFLPRIIKLSRLAIIVRLFAMFMLGTAFALELFGYLNLSTFIWTGVLASTMSIFLFFFLENLLREFYDTLDAGTFRWQQRFRSGLAILPDEPLPGLVWIRLTSIGVLWVGLILLLLKSWSFSNARISSLFSFVRDGVKVGDSQLVPADLLIGIVIFALLLLLIRWGKDSLDKKYLTRSRMDAGAREAIVTISGYVGFVLAALIGLTIAGFKLSNLALIAGALSLGIGFGLQNIVNNFVSGIILLFERPIRTGDWIVTGTTEGYVRKISVRSTEVQTFDRSDVIVPNSDLISTEVTNWTLRDKFGRVIIKLGVAYGSDTELVRSTLRQVASSFPEIVQDRPMLPTKVLFRGFGDSTLDFELRCFIHDIAGILDITSELHFAIDKAFRENNIEIAFPQRDIHIRSAIEKP